MNATSQFAMGNRIMDEAVQCWLFGEDELRKALGSSLARGYAFKPREGIFSAKIDI
jgi:hypothetical protein